MIFEKALVLYDDDHYQLIFSAKSYKNSQMNRLPIGLNERLVASALSVEICIIVTTTEVGRYGRGHTQLAT